MQGFGARSILDPHSLGCWIWIEILNTDPDPSIPKSSVADPDPDPVGSVYYWLSWIRIRILYTDPDPAAFKLITICNLFLLFLTFH